MTSPQFDQYINRGIVHTDIPTFENFFTGIRPTKTIARYQGDGTVDITRRYAGDDQPGMSHVLAAARVPEGFGEYSNGVIVAYTSTGFTDNTLISAHGTLTASNAVSVTISDSIQRAGNYPKVLRAGETYKVRIAIHGPVSSVYDYNTGWQQITDAHLATFSGGPADGNPPYGEVYNGLPIPSDDPDFGFNNGAWGHWPNVDDGVKVNDFPNAFPFFFNGAATFVTQDIGDTLLFIYNPDSQATSTSSTRGYILKINPDLTCVSGIDNASFEYFISQNQGNPFIGQARRYYLTEDVDPTLFVYAQGQTWNAPLSTMFDSGITTLGSLTPGWSSFASTTPPNYAGSHTTGSGYKGATYQYIGPDACAYNGVNLLKEFPNVYDNGAAAFNFVKPWSSGSYGAPEIWMLRCDSTDRTYSIYRSQYSAGTYNPPSDPPGTPIAGHSWGESYGLINTETYPLVAPGCGLNGGFVNAYRTLDDPDYKYCQLPSGSPSSGTNEFPKYNPKGYAFQKDFQQPANLVSHITLPSATPVATDAAWTFSGTGHSFPYPWGRSHIAFRVWRGKHQGVLHMILIDSQNSSGVLTGVTNSLGGGNPYYNAVRDNSPNAMVWFATSSDDGATWTVARNKNTPFGGRPLGKPISTDADFVNQPVEPNGLIKRSFFTLGANTAAAILEDKYLDAVFVDATDHYIWAGCDYWQYFSRIDDTTEARIPFWGKQVADSGNHVVLWFLGEAVDIGSGQGGPSTVVFSAAKRAL